MGKRLIEKYVAAAILPYMCLALVLLTAMLLAQQVHRFAEVLGSTRAPLDLALALTLGLVPSVLLFTMPMATLAGTIIGFSRLNGDSELVALRAAGVGRCRMLAPVMLIGITATALTLYCGLTLVPAAARSLRRTTLRATLDKLSSPVDLRTFNTEIPGKVIYVRDGDEAHGQWERVFIYSQEPNAQVRVVTARQGRIDSSGDQSELVLNDAVSTTLPAPGENNYAGTQIITDRSAQLRVRLDTGRSQLLMKLRTARTGLDEMNLAELTAHGHTSAGKHKVEAATELHRRVALCVSPLCFALLGAGLSLRMRRGGRAAGVLVSLAALFIYYLTALTGEQLARAGIVPPFVGAWIAVVLTLGGSLTLLAVPDWRFTRGLNIWTGQQALAGCDAEWNQKGSRSSFILGLLDRTVLRSLFLSYAATLITLIGIFLIFTTLELGRFIKATPASASLVARYLFFLLPLATVAVAPVSLLVAVLVTYAVMARRGEAIAWWAAGQSVYRLALPGLLCAATVTVGMWLVQERLMPHTNIRQDALRAQIRGGVARAMTPAGRQWLASIDTKRLYAYEYDNSEANLRAPLIFDFDDEQVHLERILTATKGVWIDAQRLELQHPTKLLGTTTDFLPLATQLTTPSQIVDVTEPSAAFKPTLSKPMHLSTKRLSEYIRRLKQRSEYGALVPATVAYERRFSDPFAPFVMLCIGAPLALIYGRRNAIAALAAAVGITLLFMGVISGFQQLGVNGFLSPFVAVWTPLGVFSAVGIYALSRTAT